MNKQIIISIIVIIIGVGSLVWWSKSVDNKKLNAEESQKYHLARQGNALSAEETFYDFGTISMKNGNVSKIFKVINNSSEDIKVPSVTTSCMCTTAYIMGEDGKRSRPFGMPGHGGAVPKANALVKAGESLDIEVVYDPNAHGPAGVGLIERSVFMEDENSNVIEFKFKVNATP
ncbi:hypothetical protein A3A03_03690 [Candidatus Nomurabacteria bacterium RIFCSPLOWO2_01_FULL_40_18]|uniref:DUF1573 domain-containing protein n=1 Tax=Candidatus Nomurabacteria bacterium RIFCSPLOWO2_01_FULL_40_18 TaxID=1801773 RepID=A0A1F6XJ10_9BACT|nr:MAG: hypothetical protein A3A03_03690 [Candidatus Nomurabacteria bacterium RIFCSPLOWO2_01_FULL_40_18]